MPATDVRAVEQLPALEHEHELLEQATDYLCLGTRDADLVAAHVDLGAGEAGLHEPQQLVVLPE